MASYNSCQFMGNVSRDADMKYFASGTAVAEFTLAVNERRKDKDGKYVDDTEWVNCKLLGKSAENLSQYITKGKSVFVEGKLKTRSWENDQGVKQYRTEILVNTVEFLDRKGN